MPPKKCRPKERDDDAPPADPAAVAFEGFPPLPDEPHLTVDGAILDSFGKLELSAYVGLKDLFVDEAHRDTHPVPGNPGTQLDEQEQLQKNLKCWSDARGKGWIATWKKNNKWFNASTWGSWRLAFVLARLQRDVWSKREAPLALEDGVAADAIAPALRRPKRGRPSKVQVAAAEELLPGEGGASSSAASAGQGDAPVGADGDAEPLPGKKPRKKAPAAEAFDEELEQEDAAEVAAVRAVMGAATEVAASVRRRKRPLAGKLLPSRGHGRPFSAALNAAAPQRQGIGNADDVVILPDAKRTQAFMGFPVEPDEARLTVAGAKFEENGKLIASEYADLSSHFADEAPREMHPVPAKPGVKVEEQEQLQGLRSWSDAKGQGWIASGPLTHWFNVKKWGSWRLAFLLARLQVAVWSKDGGAETQQPQRRRTLTPTRKQSHERDKDQRPQRGRHFRLRPRARAQHELRIATVAKLRPKRGRKHKDQSNAVVSDETRLSQIRPALGKMPKEGARMDPRSKLIQLRRREKAALRVGVKASSSFESLGEVIDEARAGQQLDLLVLAGASHDELSGAGVNTALTAEERAAIKAERAAAAQARQARIKVAAEALVHSATVRSPLKGTAEELDHSASSAFIAVSASSSSSSTARASLPEAEARSAASPAPIASLPEAATRHAVAPHPVPEAAAEASKLPVAHVGADGVVRVGPKAEEDVNAVIKELLKIGAMYQGEIN